MVDFDKYTYYAQLCEIETYLGYVRGNEIVEEYAAQLDAQYNADYDQKAVAFGTRCPDSTCTQWIPLKLAYPDDMEDKIFDALHKAWATGPAWAAGIAAYCDSLAGQITEPDTVAMAGAITELQNDVVKKLSEIQDDQWAYLDGMNAAWRGDAGRKFTELYDNYNERLNLWGQYAGNATLGFALATGLIAGHQYAVGKYVTSVRDGAKAMAQTWPDCKYGGTDAPQWITDAETIGKDVLDIFNGTKVIKTIDDVVGKIGSAVDIINTIAPEHKDVDFSAKTAEELYRQLTSELYDKHLLPMQQSLADLSAGNAPGAVALSDDLDSATFASTDIRNALEDKRREQWILADPGRRDLNTNGAAYPPP